jgi:hypothetical protein
VQQRGPRGASLIARSKPALRSRTLDPSFGARGDAGCSNPLRSSGASRARRPDSIELLRGRESEHPEVVENQLRLAEANIALGDPNPAGLPLCVCLAHRDALRRDDQQLLDQLVATTGALDCDKPG